MNDFKLKSLPMKIKINSDLIKQYQKYIDILTTWQKSINLISNSSLTHIWERHIEDSIQLLNHIPKKNQTIFDLGSGAGFPALALAVANPDNQYHLIESDSRKCAFLQIIKAELSLKNVVIHNQRIENFAKNPLKADIITSRALASLSILLDLSSKLVKQSSYCLFLKGEKYQKEIQEVKNFNLVEKIEQNNSLIKAQKQSLSEEKPLSYETMNSITSKQAKIIKIYF